MATTEGQPNVTGSEKKEIPPTIVTLEAKRQQRKDESDDTASKKSESSEKRDEVSFRQARTPKHANKTMSLTEAEKQGDESKPRELHYPPRSAVGGPQAAYAPNSFHVREQPHHQQYPPPHYDAAQRLPPSGNAGDEYSPRDRQFYANRPRTMPTVSPGGADAQYRNYYPPAASSRVAGEAEFAPRVGASYGQAPPRYDSFRPPPQGEYRGYEQQQHFGYNSGGPSYPPTGPYSRAYAPREEYRGGNPATYQPPYLPRDYQQRHNSNEGRYPEQAGPVSRAVSSSFDRSIKSREEAANYSKALMEHHHPHYPPQTQDGSVGGASDDSSWHKLNQVASIDEAAVQERLSNKHTPRNSKEPASTSSSLTNSPNDDNKPPLPTPSKLAALDSLSSVASGQEPIDTKVGPPSPGSSTASLDLMKCHSGSSGLLHGFPAPLHSRDMSSGSLQIPAEYRLETKRSREERGDANTSVSKEVDLRRAPSGDGSKLPVAKKHKTEKAMTKSSPLGIDCSPPLSPSKEQQRETARGRSLEQGYSFNSSPGQNYFDKPPLHTYSGESAGRGAGYPPILRPGSSTSSTATPHEGPRDTIGPALPSWDIQAQDSFGAASLGGGQVMSNFSFSNDYPMLSGSGSNLERPSSIHSTSELTQQQRNGLPSQMRHPGHHIETRNQSFEGGNYHGSFNRSDTMESGYRRNGPPPPGYLDQGNYKPQGHYPPHAPSWGTTQPTPHVQYPGPPPSYNQFHSRSGPSASQRSPHRGPYMGSRNFSEDSGVRASPPPPALVGRNSNPFAPPPEFSAPHNPHLARRPPPAVYIMSSGGGQQSDPNTLASARAGTGVYSWNKDDDYRLTEVMKKYKNPRDWEPIAKEHGRGKNAKECHERWIRYLKPGVRKGQWQDHEDAIVVEAVSTSTEQPFTRWSDLAQRLPGRVGKQIRDRWVNHLNPSINHLPFSKEDDMLLWNGHKKHGKRWVEISSKFFINSRSENHIKNRWYSASFKKFIANEFGPDAYNGGKAQKKEKKPIGKKLSEEEIDVSLESV